MLLALAACAWAAWHFAGLPEFTDGVEHTERAVRRLGSQLEFSSEINQSAVPFRLVDGPRASVSVSCAPSGSLAIPARARVAGITVGLLPVEAWAPLPEAPEPTMLHEIEWATRSEGGTRQAVGTWSLGLEFDAAE